ncbi:ribosome maturation factor RimM [Profundibacter sp.]|uniref:ribosome maturation factor RimM n=1 Tax=Profundibacter sp. TaxID=3101071 RepID=UPI003D0C446F
MGNPDHICVGAFSGSYGVNGEVRLKSFCADPEAIADYSPLTTEDGKRSYAITITRSIKGALVAKVEGITKKEMADDLKGIRLFARRDQLPALPDDEFYHADLIGLTVLDTGGTVLGKVHAVQNHGASDLLEIMPDAGGNTILLPFTREVVPTVDLTAGRIIADPPEGAI